MRMRSFGGRAAACGLLLAIGTACTVFSILSQRSDQWSRPPATLPAAIPLSTILLDTRPVAATVTIGWHTATLPSTMDTFIRSPFYWRNMQIGDWDRLPEAIRAPALDRMRAHYARLFSDPLVWTRMDAFDWDAVPQPLRMVAFPLMLEYWVHVYALPESFGLPAADLTRTLSAIVMAESWFDHRAWFENKWGNRDIGLGQCSNRCRRVLAELGAKGDIDFVLTDDDYFNPWNATRATTVWFALELLRAGGDMNLAIRAYHRGFDAAVRGDGEPYLANVQRVRDRYFSDSIYSETWTALRVWSRRTAAALPVGLPHPAPALAQPATVRLRRPGDIAPAGAVVPTDPASHPRVGAPPR